VEDDNHNSLFAKQKLMIILFSSWLLKDRNNLVYLRKHYST